MKMFLRLFPAIAVPLLLLGECVQVPVIGDSSLEIVATDLTGRPINEVEIELYPAGSSVAEIRTSSTNIRVRYGTYRLLVYAKGFRPTSREMREISVDQPETIVRVELAVGFIGCPPALPAIAGHSDQDRSRGELWVKAIPVRGIGGGEARVSDSGYFRIDGLEFSSYLVIVVQGESVLHQQVVKTYPAGGNFSNLTIHLSRGR